MASSRKEGGDGKEWLEVQPARSDQKMDCKERNTQGDASDDDGDGKSGLPAEITMHHGKSSKDEEDDVSGKCCPNNDNNNKNNSQRFSNEDDEGTKSGDTITCRNNY